jgi:hypothetical protein
VVEIMSTNRYILLRLCFAKCPSLVASVLMATTFVACHITDPMQPEAPTAPVIYREYASADGCPSFQEACLQGRAAVERDCPGDGTYKKPGDYGKCIRDAIRDYLRDIDSCFSQSDQSRIKRCILASFPLATRASSSAAGKERFRSEE